MQQCLPHSVCYLFFDSHGSGFYFLTVFSNFQLSLAYRHYSLTYFIYNVGHTCTIVCSLHARNFFFNIVYKQFPSLYENIFLICNVSFSTTLLFGTLYFALSICKCLFWCKLHELQMNLALVLLMEGNHILESSVYCIHTRTSIIIRIINRHGSEMVSKESHLPINYDHKLLPLHSLINYCAVTQKEMSNDKWGLDLKAARSAKHLPLQFISNFTVNL